MLGSEAESYVGLKDETSCADVKPLLSDVLWIN